MIRQTLILTFMMAGCCSEQYREREVKILMKDAYTSGFVDGQDSTAKLKKMDFSDLHTPLSQKFEQYYRTPGLQGLERDFLEGKQ